MRITHLVCTSNFAGVERHIAVLAQAQHDRGHSVTVLGGDPSRMSEAINRPGVDIQPVEGVFDAMRRLVGPAGHHADVVATHMTAADLAAAATAAVRGVPVVSTRHFAGKRGSSPPARTAAALATARISAQIAVSRFVADAARDDATVVLPGIPNRPPPTPLAQRDRRILLVQRLESEKATDVGLHAFAASGLATEGWRLTVIGDGAQRAPLEALATTLGISSATDFLGHRSDVDDLMDQAGILLATCPAEGLGLTVLEAMASGVSVVATGSGGHLETVGATAGCRLFPPGDAAAAALLLRDLAHDPARRDTYGTALREHQQSVFATAAQAAATDEVYRYAMSTMHERPAPRIPARDLVVISLEPWDGVWRRNQHLVAGLLREDPDLRVLFVEPATDPLHSARTGTRPRRSRGLRRGPHLPGVDPDALWLLEPTKALPRRVDKRLDERWAKKVRSAAAELHMHAPLLWVNDPHGGEVLELTRWATIYDITDDWLEAERDAATLSRISRYEALLMDRASEVVVCSTALERSKGQIRTVTLLHNAVDAQTISPTPRPTDLPPGPTAVYVGTLHSDRLDVELCVATAAALGDVGTLVLVGPNALSVSETQLLDDAGVVRLGARDRREVPGHLQHADVLVVPHVVDDFTDSLDPIKLYEYRAVGRPVVSTPVAGFREAAGGRVRIVDAAHFPAAVLHALPAKDAFPAGADPDVPTWSDRVQEMRAVLERVRVAQDRDVQVDTTAVPTRVRVRLGHAAVQWIADQRGVDVLHIKGAALDASLTHPGRMSTDADVLVRPEHVDPLLRSLEAEGFVPKGRFSTSSPFGHSATLHHELWGYVDVHRLYPGIGVSPEEAFDRLFRGGHNVTIAGRPCRVPEVAAQIVVLILHAARSAPGGQTGQDVEHVWRSASEESRRATRALVQDLAAQVAFAIGIGDTDGLPPSSELELWQAVSRPDGRLREWRARIAAAPDVRSRIALVARLPLVNTDHLATRLGHRPSPAEVATEFVDRARRAMLELWGRR